jgi:hypothetical protein
VHVLAPPTTLAVLRRLKAAFAECDALDTAAKVADTGRAIV